VSAVITGSQINLEIPVTAAGVQLPGLRIWDHKVEIAPDPSNALAVRFSIGYGARDVDGQRRTLNPTSNPVQVYIPSGVLSEVIVFGTPPDRILISSPSTPAHEVKMARRDHRLNSLFGGGGGGGGNGNGGGKGGNGNGSPPLAE